MAKARSASPTLLVVDDEPALREVLALRLGEWGYAVHTAGDVAEAERQLAERVPDAVLSDLVLPDSTGIDLLRRLKRQNPDVPVILMTAHGTIDAAVEAMKHGAQDFLTKPLDYVTLRALLESTATDLRRRADVRALEARLESEPGLGRLVGLSAQMRELYPVIRALASSDAPALIAGESGTGKEVAARTIHELSGRRAGPFVAVNAAAIPEGLIESEIFGHEAGAFTGATQARPGCFELAAGGTLFLDEIAEMPAALQPKLLRVLEDGAARRVGGSREIAYNARVLAATNRVPLAAVDDGRLRRDLWYRLNVFELTLPPLRGRGGDIALLGQQFVRQGNERHGTSVRGLREPAQARLNAHAWPGNVRELRNVIERAVIVARDGWIEVSHLPPYLQKAAFASPATLQLPIGTTLAEAERSLILQTLDRVGHNKAEAARQLGLDEKTIRNKLKTYRARSSLS